MKEPSLTYDEGATFVPLSRLPTSELRAIAGGEPIVAVPTADDPSTDLGFARLYAKILLRERPS